MATTLCLHCGTPCPPNPDGSGCLAYCSLACEEAEGANDEDTALASTEGATNQPIPPKAPDGVRTL
jgi:hypothetical protein